MELEKTFERYYYLTGDQRSKVGVASPVNENVGWDFFEGKDSNFELSEQLVFKITPGKFSGTVGDYQINSCGFLLFSNRLRNIIEKYLTNIDSPKWFKARVINVDNQEYEYSILYLFNKVDFLDHEKSTFINGTNHPIILRFDLNKIGDRLIYNPEKLSVQLCVHDIVRKEIKKSGSIGMYFYKIHTVGRLS